MAIHQTPEQLRRDMARVTGYPSTDYFHDRQRIQERAAGEIKAYAHVLLEPPVAGLLGIAADMATGASERDLLECVRALFGVEDADGYADAVDCVQKAAANYAKAHGWDE